MKELLVGIHDELRAFRRFVTTVAYTSLVLVARAAIAERS